MTRFPYLRSADDMSSLLGTPWVLNMALVAVIVVINTFIYNEQIAGSLFYYLPINLNISYGIFYIFVATTLALLIPPRLKSPSDFMVFFHLVFVCLSFAVFFPGKLDLPPIVAWGFYVLLLLPVLAVKAVAIVPVPVVAGPLSPANTFRAAPALFITFVLAVVCVTLVAGAIYLSPSATGLDLASAYLRRLAARDQTPQAVAYVMQISGNALIPYLAFRFGVSRLFYGIVICLLLDLGLYFIDGVKGIFIYSCASFGLGLWLSRERKTPLVLAICAVVVGLFVLVLIEGFPSMVAEYFFRRLFVVPGIGITAYIEAFFYGPRDYWSPIAGMLYDESVSFFVGSEIYEASGTNANTNSFVFLLADAGVLGFCAGVALVAVIYRALDGIYEITQDPSFVFVGFQYAALLVEQNAFTALTSSGIAVLLIGCTALAYFVGPWRSG